MCSNCPALPPLQQATRPLKPRSSRGITSASTWKATQCFVCRLRPRRVASWPALYVVLTLTFASLRPPPIPQPQMYHGVSPAATSGGNNGNMVSLQSSFSFHPLPWPSCLSISIYSMVPALLRLQLPKTAEPTAGQLESPYSNFYHSYLISPQSRGLSQEISALSRAGAPAYPCLIGRPGAQKFFFSVPSSLSIMIIFIGRAP